MMMRNRYFGLWMVFLLSGITRAIGPRSTDEDRKYLSDVDADYHYVEMQQGIAYASVRAAFRPRTADQAEKAVVKQKKSISDALSSAGLPTHTSESDAAIESLIKQMHQPLPTRYEDPVSFYLLQQQIHSITQASSKLGLSSIVPKFGTLPTDTIQGQTISVPDTGNRVVLLNTQLFNASFAMTKAIIQTLEVTTSSGQAGFHYGAAVTRSRITAHPEIREQFLYIVLRFLGISVPRKTYQLDPKYFPLVATMTQAINLFAVAHEYGHFIKQHQPIGYEELRTSTGKLNVAVLRQSWCQELEADDIGVRILLKAAAQDENPLHRMFLGLQERAPLLFFKYVEILENAKKVLDTGSSKIAVTPHEQTRIEQFLRAYDRNESSNKVISRCSQDNLKNIEIDQQFDSHPPTDIRARFLNETLIRETSRNRSQEEEVLPADIARELENAAGALFEAIVPDLNRVRNGEEILNVLKSRTENKH